MRRSIRSLAPLWHVRGRRVGVTGLVTSAVSPTPLLLATPVVSGDYHALTAPRSTRWLLPGWSLATPPPPRAQHAARSTLPLARLPAAAYCRAVEPHTATGSARRWSRRPASRPARRHPRAPRQSPAPATSPSPAPGTPCHAQSAPAAASARRWGSPVPGLPPAARPSRCRRPRRWPVHTARQLTALMARCDLMMQNYAAQAEANPAAAGERICRRLETMWSSLRVTAALCDVGVIGARPDSIQRLIRRTLAQWSAFHPVSIAARGRSRPPSWAVPTG